MRMREKLTWLHISDIHFCPESEWRDSSSRLALLDYFESIFSKDDSLRPDFIFCTGDIAYGESTFGSLLSDQYNQAKDFFDKLLLTCGRNNESLPKDRLFVVPGNHDVNRKKINTDAQETLNKWSDQSSNYINEINKRFDKRPNEFKDNIKRLDEYAEFVKDYLPHQHDTEGRIHYARINNIDGLKVGIAGFNSAWTCAGPEDDRKIWLAAEWQFNSAKEKLNDADINIGLIHHPIDWLNSAERTIATQRTGSDFDFWLHGHNHSLWLTPIQSHIIIAAGAVSAETSEEFGVNIVTLDLNKLKGIAHLHNRKRDNTGWTLTPVNMHAPTGQWSFNLPNNLLKKLSSASGVTTQTEVISSCEKDISIKEHVNRYLSKRLNDALESFSSQPKVLIRPTLYRKSEIASNAKYESESELNLSEFIANPKSTIIKAPPQYGLTCLSHYLIKEAWNTQNSSLWLYLDAKTLKPHNASINHAITEELENLSCIEQDIKCVILDSWSTHEKDAIKLLSKLCERFENVPIICMQQTDSDLFAQVSNDKYIREFETLYLWALRKEAIRKIVSNYNEEKPIGDEDAVTKRIASDLEVLNLHRTPLNCITLLKVFEANFDESPINRPEMINRVLFLLFNAADDIPTYKARPDLKDCEYVLGYFCELLIRNELYSFTREYFLQEIHKCCVEGFIDLEIQVVFDILYKNNILIKRGNDFNFKFAYWFYYFAAIRMRHDESFANYMLDEMRYAHYPELIEFYTGIDRKREDALTILIKDIQSSSESVKNRCGLPSDMNPYKFAKWESSDTTMKQMQEEISNGVRDSNLPSEIKDQYSDQTYNPAKPYHQEIKCILNEYSFMSMMRIMRIGARALRNSDYASPKIKQQLLNEILQCWELSSKIVFIIMPILAEEGHAAYDGTRFILCGNPGSTPSERFFNLLTQTPSIIVSWCKDDLFSNKMGPLLIDQLQRKEIAEISKHELILLLINQRPREWKKQIQDYIAASPRNSFYLMDVYRNLRMQYQYGYASPSTLKDIEFLIKMVATKHVTGNKNPGKVTIKKTKFQNEIIPPREV